MSTTTATWPDTEQEKVAYVDWQYEAGNGDTILGFRDWLAHRADAEAADAAVVVEETEPHPFAGFVSPVDDDAMNHLDCANASLTLAQPLIDAQNAQIAAEKAQNERGAQ